MCRDIVNFLLVLVLLLVLERQTARFRGRGPGRGRLRPPDGRIGPRFRFVSACWYSKMVDTLRSVHPTCNPPAHPSWFYTASPGPPVRVEPDPPCRLFPRILQSTHPRKYLQNQLRTPRSAPPPHIVNETTGSERLFQERSTYFCPLPSNKLCHGTERSTPCPVRSRQRRSPPCSPSRA